MHGGTYTDNMLRAGLGREHAEDTRATADVEHDLVLEQMGVVDDRVPVRARPDGILEHLFMNTCETVQHSPQTCKSSAKRPTEMRVRVRIAAERQQEGARQ